MTRRAEPVAARAAMVAELREYGITDEAVLAAMDRVPRHRFVPDVSVSQAYADSPVPIDEGQTMSQPYIVAVMTQNLRLAADHRVLEIGCGSGYGAAVLAEIAALVVTVERRPELARAASAVLDELGYANVEVVVDDGSAGGPTEGPFDAISVTAGAPEVPEPLVELLAVGGRMVVPIGPQRAQVLVSVIRTEAGHEVEELGPVSFVPLVGEAGWAPDP